MATFRNRVSETLAADFMVLIYSPHKHWGTIDMELEPVSSWEDQKTHFKYTEIIPA